MDADFNRTPRETPRVKTKFREISTAIPCPGTEAVLQRLEKYESRSMQGQMPIVWDRAEGFTVFDMRGNRWIDFTSTIFVANIGHANPRVLAAIAGVSGRPLLHSYAYASEIRADYLQKLVEFAGGPFEKAFLLSAGTEATEAALKLMRMWGQKSGKRRLGIVCIAGNWHGRTMGAQMMSGNLRQKAWIGTLDPDIHHIPFPYPWLPDLEKGGDFLERGLDKLRSEGVDIAKDICGFMLETFQGWGAVFYPEDYVQAIEALCREKGILLAFDEMQSGFARTGRKFGYENYGVRPDLICCGKGMGSGLPLSGVLGPAEIMDLPETGNMSSTHSANPLACSVGLATLEEIEAGNLVSEAGRKGIVLQQRLEGLKRKYPEVICDITGRGMIAAVLFGDRQSNRVYSGLAGRIAHRCLAKGLLVVNTGRESIKIGPPLIIPDEALIEGVAVIDESIAEILEEER